MNQGLTVHKVDMLWVKFILLSSCPCCNKELTRQRHSCGAKMKVLFQYTLREEQARVKVEKGRLLTVRLLIIGFGQDREVLD